MSVVPRKKGVCYLKTRKVVQVGCSRNCTIPHFPFVFLLAKKQFRTLHFCPEASTNQPIQVKQYNGGHKLEQRKHPPNDGWGRSEQCSKGFGDERREKSGEFVPQVKQYNSCHKLKQRKHLPNNGWGGSKQCSKEFGDGRREKDGKFFPAKAEDHLGGRGSARGVQNGPDGAARATNMVNKPPAMGKKSRSGAKAANVVSVATNVPQKALARWPKAKLLPTRNLTASNKSAGNESNERKEARGAQDDIIIHYENDNKGNVKVEESINGESDNEDAAKLISLRREMEALEYPKKPRPDGRSPSYCQHTT